MTIDPTAVELDTCAEEVLHLLAAHGIEILFLNPGTDSAPLQEAAATLAERGVAIPRLVTSSFESVALAAAHGYFQVTRRPQAVFVHVDVGTQNLGAIVHDVLRDRAGVVILAGKTPYGEEPGAPGGRSSPIHWQQDMPDQAGVVRSYAKWANELVRSGDTARVIGRAVQVAGGGAPGLAYLMLSRDVLMDPAGPAERRRITGWARPLPAAMSRDAVELVSDLLADAERPVIVTNRVGRTPGGSEALARLADIGAIPVLGRPEAMNLPSDHPMFRQEPKVVGDLLITADVVVVVESDVPWIPRHTTLAPGAKVVHIDPDPLKADMPMWTFPVDLAVTADGATALAQLAEALEARHLGDSPRVEQRRASLGGGAGPHRDPEASGRASGRLDIEAVLAALNGVLEPEDIVVEEAVTASGLVGALLERTVPGTLCSAGGPGLGWALGASVGIKLAAPDRRVVAVVGDGSFMFGVPTAAFCLAAEAEAPYVVVVLNNNGYRASRLPVFELFPDGLSAHRGDAIGTRFRRPPDFAEVSRACGGFGATVEDLASLPGALQAALAAADSGSVAVVDVHLDDV